MAHTLTVVQSSALSKLADGESSAYRLRAGLGTLRSLEKRGLVVSRGGLGSMAFPHTSIQWRITEAGRNALANGGTK
jgi:hypothetical protein